VKRSLEGIEGVTEAEVSHKENKAWVTVDGKVTNEMLVEAVAKAGRFTGKVVSREPAEPSPDS
jgi:copper chaperone CopZ